MLVPERHLALHNEHCAGGVGAGFHGDEHCESDGLLALFIHEIVIAQRPLLRVICL